MEEVTTERAVEKFIASFESGSLKGSHTLRNAGKAAFAGLDFPAIKEEDWKYTRVSKLAKESYSFQKSEDPIDLKPFLVDEKIDRLVFVNGFLRKDLSTPELADQVVSTAQLDNWISPLDRNVFVAMNAAWFTDGIHFSINSNWENRVQVVFLSSGNKTTSQIRNNVSCSGKGAAHIILSFFSLDNGNQFSNVITEISVAANGAVQLDLLQYEKENTTHIHTVEVRQERDSRFSINTLSLNSALIRNDLRITSAGENTETHLNGLYLLKGSQHVDNHTMVDHTMPNCISNETYKGIIDDKATAVFNGKVFVRQDAQKINAYQSNANVLLSDDATINTKPELEIYADDVKCSHGSTTGQLDEEALFYLRARGVGEDSARKLLVKAFAADVLNSLEYDPYREFVEQLIEDRFHWSAE